MKTMLIRKSCLRLVLLAGVSGAIAMAQTTTTTATTRAQTFGPIGMGSSETAEINLVNVASNSTAGTAASCTGTVSFTNAAGTILGGTSATNFTLTSGQSSSYRLQFTAAGLTGARGLIKAVVTLTQSTATPRPPCSLDTSFELYDTATNATHVVLTGEESGGGRD